MIIETDNIPKTLAETYAFIDNMDMNDIDDWCNLTVKTALARGHHSFGQWIRNNFGLWEEETNDLKQWFIDNYFITHPDDISSMILVNFHERKNGNVPDMNKEANRYHEFWSVNDFKYKLKLRKFKLNKLCSELKKYSNQEK